VSYVVYVEETKGKFSSFLATKCCQGGIRNIRVVEVSSFMSGLVEWRLAVVIKESIAKRKASLKESKGRV